MLEAHHLVKRYYGAAVVDDVTFEPGNLKALGPIYLMLLLVAAYNLARIERWGLANRARFAGLVGCLVLIYAAARVRRVERPSLLTRIELDDLPETSTQRLGLSEPV